MMMNKWLMIAALMIAPLWIHAEHLLEYDSVGVKTVNGNVMIIHRVKQGETLYSLARHYQVAVDDILRANPGMSKNLKIDELVKIPYLRNKTKSAGSGNSGIAFHIVKPSETLFSISRKYGISIDDLRRWNNLKSDALTPGMKLAVNNGMSPPESAGAGNTRNEEENRKIHTVKPSETLFSISRRYGVSVAQIREWNHLNSDNLSIGQKLIVSEPDVAEKPEEENSSMLPAGTVAGKEKPDEKKSEDAATHAADMAAVPPAGPQKSATEPAAEKTDDDVSNYEPAEKTVERGMAEVIDDASDSRKYLALHRTAPIGTIMQIKNEMNDQIVFVRVVGRIPDTGDNEKVLIKISKKAYDRLGALDKRFPVVISYVK